LFCSAEDFFTGWTGLSLILVIEDHEDACGLIRRLLMRLGHTVVCLENEIEAKRWLELNRPDLVIVAGGRHGELAARRIEVVKGSSIGAQKILLGVRGDALEKVARRFAGEVREVFDSAQTLAAMEAMVLRAVESDIHCRVEGEGAPGMAASNQDGAMRRDEP